MAIIHRVTSAEEWERLTGEPAGGVLVISPRKPKPPTTPAPSEAEIEERGHLPDWARALLRAKKTLTAVALAIGLGVAGAAHAEELICGRAISPGDPSAAAVMTMAQRIACDGGDAALELQQRYELTELLLRLTSEPEKTALARELAASDARDEQACGITTTTPIPAPQSIVDCVRHKGLFATGFLISMLAHGTKWN